MDTNSKIPVLIAFVIWLQAIMEGDIEPVWSFFFFFFDMMFDRSYTSYICMDFDFGAPKITVGAPTSEVPKSVECHWFWHSIFEVPKSISCMHIIDHKIL